MSSSSTAVPSPPKTAASATGAKAVQPTSIWVYDSKRTWVGWTSEIGTNIVDANGNTIDKNKTFEELSRFVSATLLAAPCAYSTIWLTSDAFRDFVLYADAAMMGHHHRHHHHQYQHQHRNQVGREGECEGKEEEDEEKEEEEEEEGVVSTCNSSSKNTSTAMRTSLSWFSGAAWWMFSPYIGAFRVLVPYVAAKKRTSEDVRGFTSVMLTAMVVSFESPMRRLVMDTLFHHKVSYSAWRDVWSAVFLFGGMWCNFKSGLINSCGVDGGGGGSGSGGGKEKGREEALQVEEKKKTSRSTSSGKKNKSSKARNEDTDVLLLTQRGEDEAAAAPSCSTTTTTTPSAAAAAAAAAAGGGEGGGDDHLPANGQGAVTSTISSQSESVLNKQQELLALLRVRGTITLTATTIANISTPTTPTPTQELIFEVISREAAAAQVVDVAHSWRQRRSAMRYSVLGAILWTSGVLNKYYSLYEFDLRPLPKGGWISFTVDLLRYVPAVEAALFFVGVPNLGVSLFTEPFFQYWKGFSHDYANALTLAHYAPPLSMLLGMSLHFWHVDALLKFCGVVATLSFTSGEKIKQLLNINFAK